MKASHASADASRPTTGRRLHREKLPLSPGVSQSQHRSRRCQHSCHICFLTRSSSRRRARRIAPRRPMFSYACMFSAAGPQPQPPPPPRTKLHLHETTKRSITAVQSPSSRTLSKTTTDILVTKTTTKSFLKSEISLKVHPTMQFAELEELSHRQENGVKPLCFWKTRQAIYPSLKPIVEDTVAAPASHAYVLRRAYVLRLWTSQQRQQKRNAYVS